jgi:hypothetical protein
MTQEYIVARHWHAKDDAFALAHNTIGVVAVAVCVDVLVFE